MTREIDNATKNRYGAPRIAGRQIDELIGLARGVAADGVLNQAEVECLLTWLVANKDIANEPLIARLYRRVDEILSDGIADADECRELLVLLNHLTANEGMELGEVLKSTTLPLTEPMPDLTFPDQLYCFTGTFSYGQRPVCEAAVVARGGAAGGLTMKTNFLVIGAYATESWRHSTFGNKILKACEYREKGKPIALVSEVHWCRYLAA